MWRRGYDSFCIARLVLGHERHEHVVYSHLWRGIIQHAIALRQIRGTA